MNLGKDISNLLNKQRRVFVKGLGVFSRIRSSATFDQQRQAYLPPISYIEFDPKATEGFDFIYYLQQLLVVSYQEASAQLEQQILEIKHKLKEDGQYELSSLGLLILYGNSFVFKPEDLSGFQFAAIEAASLPQDLPAEDNVANEAAGREEQEPVVPLVTQPIAAEIIDENQIFDQDDTPKKSKAAWAYFAVALVALGGILAFYIFNQRQSPQHQTPAKETVILDTPAASIPLIDSALVGQDSLADTLSTLEDSTNLVVREVENHRYQIVIATAPTMDKAYQIAEKYHTQGFAHVKVIPSNMARNKKKVIWDT